MKEKSKKNAYCHFMLMMAIALVWAANMNATPGNKFTVESDGVTLHFTTRGNSATLVSCDAPTANDVSIPSKVMHDGVEYDVVAIGSFAFSNNGVLTSIKLPASLRSIGEYAFYHCTALGALVVPDEVSTIGSNAFDGCSALAYAQLPSSLRVIEDYTFYECANLLAIDIPAGVKRIGAMAFKGCRRMASVSIPNSVTSIGTFAFADCSSLEELIIPDQLSTVEQYTFCHCSKLTSLTIPNSVTMIDDWAFWDCTSLETITLPYSTTYVGEWAFTSCKAIRDVHSEIEKPFIISDYVFERVVKEKAVLHVPANTIKAYRDTRGWEFTNIEEEKPESYGLVLWSKDGEKMAVYALTSKPKVTFDTYGFTVSSTDTDVELYNLQNLARFTYEKMNPASVRNIVPDETTMRMEGESLVFPSLQANCTVKVYAPNGAVLTSATTKEQGDYALSLSGLDRGIYLIQVDNGSTCTTFKIVRR